jgi:hypothetical protein
MARYACLCLVLCSLLVIIDCGVLFAGAPVYSNSECNNSGSISCQGFTTCVQEANDTSGTMLCYAYSCNSQTKTINVIACVSGSGNCSSVQTKQTATCTNCSWWGGAAAVGGQCNVVNCNGAAGGTGQTYNWWYKCS